MVLRTYLWVLRLARKNDSDMSLLTPMNFTHSLILVTAAVQSGFHGHFMCVLLKVRPNDAPIFTILRVEFAAAAGADDVNFQFRFV